ncbi:MAG: aminotransferase class V-fold PLP-dependent enzyme [Nitrososphaeria archaeon]|nr:aminotransferase class V-fold PLP-dependent enzyme [Nitrososphaeria archaeon]
MDYDSIRNDFPLLSKYTYLDTASSGAISKPVHKAIVEFIDRWLEDCEDWDRVIRDVLESRKLFSKMVNVYDDEVAVVPNTSTGLIAIVTSIEWRSNSNVVLAGHNFPTNFNIFSSLIRNGLLKEVRIARFHRGEIALEEYEKLIDDNTVLVSVDMVGWLSGYREDLREVSRIAHEKGAILVSDIFHAVGVLPLNLKELGVDAAVCGSYKWLLAPSGAAFLYIDKKLLDTFFKKCYIGWIGVEDSVVERMFKGEYKLFERPLPLLNAKPSSSVSRYEWGSWAGPTIVGLAESLRYFSRIDIELSWRRIRNLTSRLVDELIDKGFKLYSPIREDKRSGIVSIYVKNPYKVAEELSKKKIIISARPSVIRISVDFYNNEDDLERILFELDKMKNEIL